MKQRPMGIETALATLLILAAIFAGLGGTEAAAWLLVAAILTGGFHWAFGRTDAEHDAWQRNHARRR